MLYDDGTVEYHDGGEDPNKPSFSGTWELDEETGLFAMDLRDSNKNHFFLECDLTKGSDSTTMKKVRINWKKSNASVWYYEDFFRTKPEVLVTGDDREKQPGP